MSEQLTFDRVLDGPRLSTLRERLVEVLADGEWRTLGELRERIGGSEAGISARLRELRRLFGATIEKRRRGRAARGLWEYRRA